MFGESLLLSVLHMHRMKFLWGCQDRPIDLIAFCKVPPVYLSRVIEGGSFSFSELCKKTNHSNMMGMKGLYKSSLHVKTTIFGRGVSGPNLFKYCLLNDSFNFGKIWWPQIVKTLYHNNQSLRCSFLDQSIIISIQFGILAWICITDLPRKDPSWGLKDIPIDCRAAQKVCFY